MIYLFFSIAVLLLMVTLCSLSTNPHWVFRGGDFPRYQILVVSAVNMALSVVFCYDTIAPLTVTLMMGAIVCGIQLSFIFPYTKFKSIEVAQCKSNNTDSRVSLLCCNVLMTNTEVDLLKEEISSHDPDVILLLETNKWWEEHMSYLYENYPYHVDLPKENTYGMHLYSKLELLNTAVKYRVEDHVPSLEAEVVLRSKMKVNLYCLHPSPPVPTQNSTSKERDAELILVAKEVKEKSFPTIILGDMNDSAWSHTTRLFRKISGLLDPRIGRGRFATFHANIPFLRWPLDHIFHSTEFSLIEIKRLKKVGSDHFPIYVNLHLDFFNKNEEANIPEESEIKLADELISRIED